MKNKFDAVAWMRKRREEIDREDAGLSWDEKSRKTLELLANDPLWNRLKHRVARAHQVSEASTPVKPR
jgi:hypothetical protein